METPARAVLLCPLPGVEETVRCPAFPFSLCGLYMVEQNDIALIAEYERLRREAYQLDAWSEQFDARLVELERSLPDDYTYPCDSPNNLHAMLPGPLTLPHRIIFLKKAMTTARAGPWKLYPGIARIVMSFEWLELFAVASLPTTFPDYLKLIDPDDRQRIAAETKRVFLMSQTKTLGINLPPLRPTNPSPSSRHLAGPT